MSDKGVKDHGTRKGNFYYLYKYMCEKGRQPQLGERIQYLMIDGPKDCKKGELMRELKMWELDPEPLNYLYYIENLVKNIDGMVTVAYKKEFEKYGLNEISYKPYGRRKEVAFSSPMKMIHMICQDILQTDEKVLKTKLNIESCDDRNYLASQIIENYKQIVLDKIN